MMTHFDDEPINEQQRRKRDPERIEQGNPGRPQSDYENPPPGPSDEPPDGADRQP
jgi:hypothetical protein